MQLEKENIELMGNNANYNHGIESINFMQRNSLKALLIKYYLFITRRVLFIFI